MKRLFSLAVVFLVIVVSAASVFAAGYADAPTTVTTTSAKEAAAAAVKEAKASGSDPVVKFNNVSAVTKASLQAVFKESTDAKVNFRTTENGAVVVQITLTSNNVGSLSSNVSLETKKDPPAVQKKFEKVFSNQITTLQTPQIGSEYKMAVKPTVANPVFYSYDAKTNIYTPIAVKIDKNGYAHFMTTGGYIVQSSGELKAK